ncbi:hypothetical protein WCE41_13540 [Luteimonas sp. MJ246]|uniref:hypothetical protein n=1 Tax=Luteimonas sp. MJ174 TaxID=3129237 RepID=UPI0031BA470A
MKKSRFTGTRIVSMIKQAYAGVPVKDICRQAGTARRASWPAAGCNRLSGFPRSTRL